ncbi:MAG: sigma-54 dependent transcriptional regulator [Parabacteroides sp.]|nr:sigma-54 dependent transcriptional regulator [Parabacteroides sp.]
MIKLDVQQIKQRFGIIGNSPALNRAIDVALQVAPTDLSVLITGESGVGKETFPQIIHQNSPRKHGQYIAVNCGAIPEGTIDSELFGHEKGSFTGALADRKGYFEVADGGTIFLDEVGELPTPTQTRLLRVLETGEFIKVGSSKVLKTNVRIVAATNVNLTQAVSEGKFREDLFYRLNTVPIQIPPLRERPDDIILLFRKFAGDCAEKYRMPPIRLDDDARQLLTSYRWPGNVRELKNITERISVIEENRDVTADVLRLYLPDLNVEKYPVLVKQQETDQKFFNSEREILYQVLFDMKKDVNELKKLVHDIMGGNIQMPVAEETTYTHPIRPTHSVHPMHAAPIQEVETVEEEESLSLEDVEKEMIRKALEKHNGRRKNAAADLKISERTLYRKIKEYNLE